MLFFFFFFKQKTAYEMRISDWSSDVCSSDLPLDRRVADNQPVDRRGERHLGDVALVLLRQVRRDLEQERRRRGRHHPMPCGQHGVDQMGQRLSTQERKSVV